MSDAINCSDVAKKIKETTSKIPVIAVTSQIGNLCERTDYHVSSMEPHELLELIRSLLGDPRKMNGA
jgi:hypothetical protein